LLSEVDPDETETPGNQYFVSGQGKLPRG
jgi:hypothetical protein